MQVDNAVAISLLIISRSKAESPDPADGKHDHTGNCQPRYKPATDLIQPWWDRQLMQCFPHSFDTRLEQKSVIQRY
ncbi:Uncharacterised protein [Shigella sonnei]|nr:Uncharacterised protein [Shigella sonnei]CSP87552.1 Uncharacterised protein [Shigella sonnei]SRN46924.1 Uncharacterised protein [Shigella flexneri]